MKRSSGPSSGFEAEVDDEDVFDARVEVEDDSSGEEVVERA